MISTDKSAGRFGGLREDQIQRYSRAILLPQVGGRGQRRLLEASASVVGGGLAARVALAYLAAAGVGVLRTLAGDEALVADMRDLNPDVRWTAEAPRAGDLLIAVGRAAPGNWSGPWIHGAVRGRRLTVSRFPAGWPVGRAAEDSIEVDAGAAMLLGTLLATEAQKVLLGLADPDVAESWTLDRETYGSARLRRAAPTGRDPEMEH